MGLLRSWGGVVAWLGLSAVACKAGDDDTSTAETGAADTETADTETSDTETADTETADTESSAACEALDPAAPETACGTWLDTDEGCGGGSGGGTDTGGADTGDTETGGCVDDTDASNAEVVACVAQAAADGEAISVGLKYYRFGGQFDTTRRWHVAADGQMWSTYSGYEDLCTIDETTLHEAVDRSALAACSSWGCIESAMNAAGLVETCEQSQNCDGV